MKKLHIILLFISLWNENAFAERVDFAVNVIKSGSVNSLLGSDFKIEILDNNSLTTLLGDVETWKVLGVCRNRPNLRLEVLNSDSISSILEDVKKVKIINNPIVNADKTICITNAKELDTETLKLFKLLD